VAGREVKSSGKMTLQRNHRDIDMRSREPGCTLGKYAIAGAQGHPTEPPVHALILQYIEESQVGAVRSRAPEVPCCWERERRGPGSAMAAGNDALSSLKIGEDDHEGRPDHLDVFAGGGGSGR
jgi:hypothetical protein